MTFTAYNQFIYDLGKGGLEYAAKHAKDLEFTSVEFLDFCPLNGKKALFEKYDTEEINRILAEYGLSVACVSVYTDLLTEEREKCDKLLLKQIKFAADIGAKNFHHTLIPGIKDYSGRPKYDEIFDEIVERESVFAYQCAEYGINCIYEPQGLYFNGITGLSRLIEEMKKRSHNIGFCADVGNSVFVECDEVELFEHLAKFTKHVHIKDYIISDSSLVMKSEMRSLGGKYIYDVLPGGGNIDIASCLKCLKDVGYDGDMALEYLGSDEEIRSSMEYIRTLWNN